MRKFLRGDPGSSAPAPTGWAPRSILIGGVLLLGAGAGLLWSPWRGTNAVEMARQPDDELDPVAIVTNSDPLSSSGPSVLRTAIVRLDPAEMTPPADPFQPSSREASFAVGPSAPGPDVMVASVAPPVQSAPPEDPKSSRSIAAAVTPEPTAPVLPASSREEEPQLTGLIQGTPSLAVVRYQGQSFFLKAGDQIFDQWRLLEIRERSAVFELGAKQVEISIRGGSSE